MFNQHVFIGNIQPTTVSRDTKLSHIVPALANKVNVFSSSLGHIKTVSRGNPYPKEEMEKNRQQEKRQGDVYDRMWLRVISCFGYRQAPAMPQAVYPYSKMWFSISYVFTTLLWTTERCLDKCHLDRCQNLDIYSLS